MRTHNIVSFEKQRLNYWGIPKSGNTTMKYSLLRAEGFEKFENIKFKNGQTRNFVGEITNGWIHNHCIDIDPNIAKKNGFRNFTVVRNPIDRFYSMFKTLPNLGVNMQGFQISLRSLFDHFTEENFLDLLEYTLDQNRNIHLRSQSSFLIFDTIETFKLETISNNVSLISPNLKVEKVLNRIPNRNEYNDNLENKILEIFKEDQTLWENAK